MNETEWLRGRDPEVMLAAVGGRMTPRKWVLLQCAVARTFIDRVYAEVDPEAIDRFEMDWRRTPENLTIPPGPETTRRTGTMAYSMDPPEPSYESAGTNRAADRFRRSSFREWTDWHPPAYRFLSRFPIDARNEAVWGVCRPLISCVRLGEAKSVIYQRAAEEAERQPKRAERKGRPRKDRVQELRKAAVEEINAAMRNYAKPANDLLRHFLHEQFGNPYRPNAFDPSWRSADVVNLATGIEAGRAFDRMPILADALEEAGCTDAAMLTHLRAEVEHQCGCWVLDAILERDPDAFPPEPLVETTGDHGRTEPLGLAYPGRMEV